MIIGRLFGTGIEYIGSEDDGTIEATSFFIIEEFKTYIGVSTEWLEKMDKDQISKRLKCAAKYGERAQEIVDSLAEFELWFDKILPDSAIESFIANTLHSDFFFKREINDEGSPSGLKIYRFVAPDLVEIFKDRGEETFQMAFGRMLLGSLRFGRGQYNLEER